MMTKSMRRPIVSSISTDTVIDPTTGNCVGVPTYTLNVVNTRWLNQVYEKARHFMWSDVDENLVDVQDLEKPGSAPR